MTWVRLLISVTVLLLSDDFHWLHRLTLDFSKIRSVKKFYYIFPFTCFKKVKSG